MNLNKNIWKGIIFLSLFSLVLIVLTTDFYGNTDTYDYSNVAKFFSGDFDARIRTSHSFLYGFIHYPLVDILNNFFIFKITSIIFLGLIIYSIYIISGRSKRALWLSLFSPIIWYMAPWISPIQLATLFFIWSYFFIKKYDLSNNIKNLFYSGILIGLSWAFWDGVLFFIPLFAISFLYNKKSSHLIFFFIVLIIAAIPRLILDYVLFGFAFQGIIRHIMATAAILFYGGLDGSTLTSKAMTIALLFFIPWISYLLLRKEIFKSNKKEIFFITSSLIILIINSQIRMLLLIYPMIIIILSNNLSDKIFRLQLITFVVITLIVTAPYILQINSSIGSIQGQDIGSLIVFGHELNNRFSKEEISKDLKKIGEEYPGETFIVGNDDDKYASLSNLYWGESIKEFVSIQDYKLFLSNNPVISEKTVCTNSRITARRDFCASISIRNSFNDETDYSSIVYAITDKEEISLEGFELVKKYDYLNLFKKIN